MPMGHRRRGFAEFVDLDDDDGDDEGWAEMAGGCPPLGTEGGGGANN